LRKILSKIIDSLKSWIERPRQIRIVVTAVVFTMLFSLLIHRLYVLQVLNSDSYNEKFIEKIERTIRIPGARGNIYDADGNLLAYNKLSYNVSIYDNGAYNNDYNSRNLMLYKLAQILEKHQVNIVSRFEVDIDEAGEFYFTTSGDAARRRFIANVYGVSTSKLDDTDGKYPSDISAKDAFELKKSSYAFDSLKDKDGKPVIISERTMLDMVKILFAMRQTAFQRYEKTTIAQDIDEFCMAELLENQFDLQGTSVEETYIRRYNNAKYFSHIIGYTGSVRDETQLAELRKTNPDYEITDLVGATGIEKTMEQELQGIKGKKDIYVDSFGQILEVLDEEDPKAGNDFYLSISQNLQIGIYHLLEQQLAGILANKIVDLPASEIKQAQDASEIQLSIDDAYFQLINNNVLDTRHFAKAEEGTAEKQIYDAFMEHKQTVLGNVSYELMSNDEQPMNELSREYVAYMAYIFDYLSRSSTGIVKTGKIDQQGESYLSWKNDTISLRKYLLAGISEGWVDISTLENKGNEKYRDSESIYRQIVDFVLESIVQNREFDKLIYKYMLINKDGISGKLLCMALYEQNIIPFHEEYYNELKTHNDHYAYYWLIERIKDIDITPAQLAMDPCMGSVVVTDVNTGSIKALVTYPGYDNNRINDRDYFNSCLEDLSLPLINSATQTNKAPGSTFKPVSAVAVLEEHKISAEAAVNCTGVFEEVEPNIRCWIGRPGHGNLTVAQAIENSCNYCFAEFGHRLSMTSEGTGAEPSYSTQTGIEKLRKYAAMFGLDRKSGIEIDEKEPRISDSDPERSSFGQGTNSFNNVQLARYTTALANNGKLYDLTLLSRETDSEGNLIQNFTAEQIDTIQLSGNTWNVIHAGLRSVITTGVARRVFQNYSTVEIAGKTGTAEEVKTRGNHGCFISYAPYNDPEIAVNVFIPFCYSSGNAARLARRTYDYYYGVIDLPGIIDGNARDIDIINIVDG